MLKIVESTVKLSEIREAVNERHGHQNLVVLNNIINSGPSTQYLGADGQYHEVHILFDVEDFLNMFDVGGGNITAENVGGLLRLNTVNSFADQTDGKVIGDIEIEDAIENKQINVGIVEVDVNTGAVSDGVLKYLKAGLGVSIGFDGEAITVGLLPSEDPFLGLEPKFDKNTAFNKDFDTSSQSADSTTVVGNNDTRLSDARASNDVPAWAKQSTLQAEAVPNLSAEILTSGIINPARIDDGSIQDSKLSSKFATEAQGTLADNAVRSVAAGEAEDNGKIRLSVDTGGVTSNVDVAVKGIGAIAFKDTLSSTDISGLGTAAINNMSSAVPLAPPTENNTGVLGSVGVAYGDHKHPQNYEDSYLNILMNAESASAGTLNKVARADHVHPRDAEILSILNTKSGATNLENGTPLNSLKQKDTAYVSLNIYIRPAVVAYLMSLGLPQAQAEAIADSGVEVEGSTRNVLAGLGITGDLTNTVYAALATAFGAGHTIGSPEDPQQGMGSVAMGMGLDITGKICLGVGKKQTYSVDMFTTEPEKRTARSFLVNLKEAGEFNTAYTNEQITAGNADSEVLDFGIMSGDSSFMVGANNIKGPISGAIGNINVITPGKVNNFAVGTQNLVVGDDNFVNGAINYVGGAMNLVSGDRNKTSHSMCGVIGVKLETGAKHQGIFGRYNLKNTNALLQVGNGNEGDRSNAFEVLKDGSAVIGKAPVTVMDVANKGYVDNLHSSITEVEINALFS